MPRKVRLTGTQIRVLISIVVILMTVIGVESAYIVYLRQQKSNVRFEIIELKPPRIEVPQATPTVETEESTPATPPSQVYEVEEFDYQKLIDESLMIIPEGTSISVFVVSSNDALKLIRSQNRPFLITKIGEDQYSVLIVGDVEIQGLMPQKRAYGVYLITYASERLAKDRAETLRENGFPAYVRHFIRNNRDLYSTVVGALPTYDEGKEYMKKLDWDKIKTLVGIRSEGYVAWVAP